jgi:hypothetical protein
MAGALTGPAQAHEIARPKTASGLNRDLPVSAPSDILLRTPLCSSEWQLRSGLQGCSSVNDLAADRIRRWRDAAEECSVISTASGSSIFMHRSCLILLCALAASAMAGGVEAAAQVPRIGKPRPAPPGPSTLPPLPPAVIDDTLAVGGDDVEARKVETRLSVEVRVNGRGPYQFIVDSGADTSVVGVRIARDLQLPLGTPVILNDMTHRSIVDRVKVDELSLGPRRSGTWSFRRFAKRMSAARA